MPETDFSIPIRVYYQDTDAGGVVYHATHLQFLERARYEWLRELGFTANSLIDSHGIIFMLRSLEIEYSKPATLDNLLTVTVKVTHVGRSRITVYQEILRDGIKLVSATIHIVCVGVTSLKPVSLPIPLREKIGIIK